MASAASEAGHEVHAAYVTRPPAMEVAAAYKLDKTSRQDAFDLIAKVQPDAVVDTGALHNVDFCESHMDQAMAVNREGTRNLAEACAACGAKFVFVSTDYVFDGSRGLYSEADVPSPINVYGQSKVEGEQVAMAACRDAVIVRPSVIYSWVGPQAASATSSGKPLNFGAWVAQQLRAKKELNIVTDQVGSPTLADDLAAVIIRLAASSHSGIFRTSGATPLSRFEFSVKLAKALALEESLLHPVDSSQFRQAARRPANCSLANSKVAREEGYRMMEIDAALAVFAKQAGESTV